MISTLDRIAGQLSKSVKDDAATVYKLEQETGAIVDVSSSAARRIPRNTQPQSDQEQVWYQQIADQTIDSTLMKRYGTIDEQAGGILYLASEEASYITGVTLPVGGGDLG
jgi:hypothetical protein